MMRKVLTFLGASLCLAWVVPAGAQPDMFKDVDRSHWAYDAVEALRAKGILIGYPDGYFRGKRTLTRYEFAVALQRALEKIQLTPGPKGEPGEKGEAGAQGDKGEPGEKGEAGITPDEVNELKRLANEFREELAKLGTNLNAVNARLDRLAKDLGDLRDEFNKQPKWSGGAFLGIRSDKAGNPYLDYNGRMPIGRQFVNSPAVVHQLQLGVTGKVGDGTTVTAKLDFDNYKGFLNNSLAVQGAGYTSSATNEVYVDQLEVNVPFSGVGRDSKLTFGRFTQYVSPYTLWKPDVDRYFDNPFVDDGLYRMDGLRLITNFGSLAFEGFAAQTKNVQGTNGIPYNSPIAGVNPITGNPIAVDQVGGISLKLPIRQMQGGYLRVTGLLTNQVGISSGTAGDDQVLILGADTEVKISDRVSFNGEWAKTITGKGSIASNVTGAPISNGMNNAFDGKVNYASGALNLSAGYRYIDPLFYSPGYWGWIGPALNVTNIQGPGFTAGYDFTPSFGLTLGGNFYSGARNVNVNPIKSADDIHQLKAGLRWDLSKSFKTTLDWEGVYGTVDLGAHGVVGGGKVHPTAHYFTLGAGVNLNNSTLWKLGYQIGALDLHGLGGGVFGVPNVQNFNVFTSQIAVKF